MCGGGDDKRCALSWQQNGGDGDGDDGGDGDATLMTMRKGSSNTGRSTVRPVSWCIGGPATVTLPPLDPLEADDPRGDLARRGLARSTSYQALHSALARLYRIDDFHMDRIGAGFFSEVFKVM